MNISIKKGFTLIELLVVISIIGILSAALYASFTEARQESKNKAMQAEIKEVQLAIELYKAQNGNYPPASSLGSPCSVLSVPLGKTTAQSINCGSNPIIEGLVPDFISQLPTHTDSANTNCNIVYQVDTNQSWYKLTAVNCHGGATDASEGIQSDDEFARCPNVCSAVGICDPVGAGFYESYAVYSAGGECQ